MKRLFLTLFCVALLAHAGWASSWFVAKQQEPVTDLGATFNKIITLKVSDIFEYPDNIDGTANFADEGITIEAVSDNPDVVGIYASDYYTFGKYQRIQLQQKANGLGKANITVTISKDGQEAKTTFSYEYVAMIARDLTYGVNITGPTPVDVLSNDSHMNLRFSSENSKLTVVKQPALGSCSIQDEYHYDSFNTSYARNAIVYTPAPAAINYSRDSLRYRVTLEDGSYAEATLHIIIRANPLVSKIIEFLPAPGQFTNSGGSFNDASCLIGKGSSSGSTSVPQADGLVSLGGFGGYVIVGFDQPVMNDPRNPYGVDFSIGGNAFVASYKGVWTEPGAVMVSRDDNGNGLADDEWYELAGSDYWFSTSHRNIKMTYTDPAYNTRYTVPWTTDNGMAGALLTNQFHQQPYFPDPAIYPAAAEHMTDGTLTYGGTLIRSSLDKRVPSYIEFYRCPAFGYCDNKTNNADLTIAMNPYYDDERGKSTNGFDISWAVDKDGNYVDLDHIDFVKIYTAGSVNAGWLGEWSTEVTGVGITTPEPDYVPQDYYLNYASITQLQVPVGATCQYEGLAFKNGRPIKEGTPRWWVDDESIGTIDSNGVFTGKTIGNTVIHFQQYPDAPADEFDVEVVAMTGVIIDIEGNASTVSNDSIACVNGETIYINVESLTQNKSQLNGTQSNRYIYDTYTWTNSDPTVGSISNGTFKALKPGETILTVASGIDTELSAQIKVTVLPIPETTLISGNIYIPYYTPDGSLTNDKIFTNGRNARANMRSITTDIPEVLSLDNNVIDYDFRSLDFGTFPLGITADAYGVSRDYATAIIYDADTRPTPRQLLIASGSKLIGIPTLCDSVATLSTVEYANDINSSENVRIISEGAFAWISNEDGTARFNVAKGERVADCNAKATGQIAIVEDKIIIPGSDANTVLYKTDLEPSAIGTIVTEDAHLSTEWPTQGARMIALADTVNHFTYLVTREGITALDTDNRQVASLALQIDAVTLMEATTPNAAPQSPTTAPMATSMYELAATPSSSTKTKTSIATDHENNFDIYLRNAPQHASWLRSVTRNANGSLLLSLQYEGAIDADSSITVMAEAIDNLGASVKTPLTFTIKPRIYKPSANAMEIYGVTEDSDYSATFDLADIFVRNPAVNATTEKNYYIYTDSIISSTLPLGVELQISEGNLLISAPKGTNAIGDITIQRSTEYKNRPEYGTKLTAVTIPVTLDAFAGIGDINADASLDIYPNPASDFISLGCDEPLSVEIFSMRGARVMSTQCMPGESIKVSSLPAGLYVVTATDTAGQRFTAKLMKQ